MRIQEMLSTHPRKPRMGVSQISSYIQTIFDCADACLAEEQVQNLVRCIRLNQDCCEICEVTGKILSRQTELDSTVIRAQLQACAEACRACAAECDRHAKTHEHCRVCAEACRECEEACMEAMEKFPSLAGMA